MRFKLLFAFAFLWLAGLGPTVEAQDSDKSVGEIRAAVSKLAKTFDSGKAAEMAALFTAKGELIDEDGTLYQGEQELNKLFAAFFERFPGAKLALDVESVRVLGPNLAIEEGTRRIETSKGDAKAKLRYTSIWTKTEGKWLLASLREFSDEDEPTPEERLKSLAWLIGEWVNEGTDGVVKLSYRWSDDKNFLLAEFDVTVEGKAARKSSQRIGWDAAAGQLRSWLFDSDGGFSEGRWTAVDDDEWVIKSQSVNPDGNSGTATITIQAKGKNRFVMKGTDRIIGNAKAPDFEVAVVRKPPTAVK